MIDITVKTTVETVEALKEQEDFSREILFLSFI